MCPIENISPLQKKNCDALIVRRQAVHRFHGRHMGSLASAPWAVSFVTGAREEPSGLTTQMFSVLFMFAELLPSKARNEKKANWLPSGDQAGLRQSVPTAVFLVTGCTPEPSGFTIQMFTIRFWFTASLPSKARKDSKAILLPSNDHASVKGLTIPAAVVSLVRGRAPDPSVLITQTFGVLCWLGELLPSKAPDETKASLVPSGDQTGPQLTEPGAVNVVKGLVPDPSTLTTQTFGINWVVLALLLPSKARNEEKASLVPSGDHFGRKLSAPDAVILVNGRAPEPSALITHMFLVPFGMVASLPSKARVEAKANLLPSGDHH